jgi:MFS family permease
MAAAPNFGVLILGRLVVGFGVGLASMIVPVYLSKLPRSGDFFKVTLHKWNMYLDLI